MLSESHSFSVSISLATSPTTRTPWPVVYEIDAVTVLASGLRERVYIE